MKEKLEELYALQQLDSALDALRRHYASLDRGQVEQPLHEAAKKAHQEALTEMQAAQAALLDTELEQKTVATKKTEEEARLYSGKVRASKELQALQEEVDMLERQRVRLDEKILVLMDNLERCRKQEAETKKAKSKIASVLRAKLTAYSAEKEKLEAQYQELHKQRTAAEKPITPNLLKQYESLRKTKGGIAIVALEDGNACGGCKMGLPASVVTRVHEGSTLVICDNCARLLCEQR